MLHSCVLAVINICILFLTVAQLIAGSNYGVALLLFYLFIFHPFTFFFHTRMRACSSWLTYKALKNEKASFKDAKKHTAHQKGALRVIAIVDILVSGSKHNGKERVSMLGAMLRALIAEDWDLVKFFSIPTVVIEQLSFKDAIAKIKDLKNHVPETLVGVFGIDLFSGVFSSLLGVVHLPILALFCAISYFGSGLFPESSLVSLGSFLGTEYNDMFFSWYPLLFAAFISTLISRCVNHIVATFKVLYFTIFYTAINRSEEIDESMRQDINAYLNLDDIPGVVDEGAQAWSKVAATMRGGKKEIRDDKKDMGDDKKE